MLRILRIHTVPDEGGGSTWLQLFFDLVYVAILVELGSRLSHDLTFEGVLLYVFLFIPIWLSWLENVQYGRYFPIDDIGQRILTVLYMFAMLLMAFEIHDITGKTGTIFLVAYALSKFILALMFGRAWIQYPEYRHVIGRHVLAFVVVGLLWIGIALAAPANFWLWGVATLAGLLAPLFIRFFRGRTGLAEQHYPPTKHQYMLHRFGELTIIVLGEFFIKLVISSSGRELAANRIYIGLCLLAISVSLWWLYFDHLEHASLTTAGSRIGLWIYSHFPFLVAITAYGVVGNKIFAATLGQALEREQWLLFTLALSIALLAFSVIEWAAREKEEPRSRPPLPLVRLGGAVALLAIGFLLGDQNVGIQVTAVATILVIQVGLDVYRRLQGSDPEVAHTAAPEISGIA